MNGKEIWHKALKVLDYVVPVAISAGLIVWLFKKVDFRDVARIIRDGCNFWWVVVMMVITTLSHMVRGVRWGIQLRGAGVPRMTVTKESVSIFGAYALNLVLPRLGEVWRCLYIARSEGVKISTVVGTDIGDRGSDAVVVAALTVICLIVAHPALMAFLHQYKVGNEIVHVASNMYLWIIVGVVLIACWVVFRYLRMFSWVRKADGTLDRIWIGFKVLFTMKGRGMYVVWTLGIWICYFMETYVMFQAFPFTRALVEAPGMAWGFVPGLVVFVFGSWSMAIPSNGGLGPWNIAVMFALSLYGISNAEGAAFAMVMWSCQAAWLVVLGLFSAGYVLTHKKNADTISAKPSVNKANANANINPTP